MTDHSDSEQAVELLKQLGLKEYESKAFVGLTRRESGTAKEVSETSGVPRTRVYDAIRVLESKGLVETQHLSPRIYRAVSIDEAINTLKAEYLDRTESLRRTLIDLEPAPDTSTEDVTHEVWALSGDQGITARARELIDGASEEVLLVIGHEDVFSEDLAAQLRAARERGVDVIVGTASEALQSDIRDELGGIEVFVSTLDWLSRSPLPNDNTEISRLLLVDREAILVSSCRIADGGRRTHEQAVFGRGFDNGLVTIVRRLMATGLLFNESIESGGS
ncbi:TrmB family transcriptional regulator [Haloarcula salina]|uniref:TrmB family transcriptional regulator n=1 Tax=Haloarcula salina TaxID=1429914 RepID=A0AA41G3A6_9EURY|nr:TrmB family transcriptional regulator [Haloarcula salina]MBV0903542.1 TrmB family transcriptional regulator [Haloarcula salina]